MQTETELNSWYIWNKTETDMEATKAVNWKNTMCTRVKCMISQVCETGNVPFLDESCMQLWTVCKLLKLGCKVNSWYIQNEWEKTQVRKKHIQNKVQTRKREETQIGNEQTHASENGG
jgi:hypothetical protein